MITAVVVGSIAITTNYWEESQADGTQETGCRVQLRRVNQLPSVTPPPQPRRDATYWSFEEPIWRADLFTTVGSPVPFDASHVHPTFSGMQPCERVLDPAIPDDPFGWIEGRLADVPGMLAEAGHADLIDGLDGEALDIAMPAVLAMIRATMAYRPGPGARVEAAV
jgi:hypothetical protein